MITSTSRKSIIASALVLSVAAAALGAGSAGASDQRNYQAPGQQQDRWSHINQGQGGDNHGGWGRDYQGNHHWRRGERIGYNDWSGAQPVDFREHHLRQPPRGYEWRESNGQYVMAAVATGVIASIILSGVR